MKKIAIILGTRPEIIKQAPLIRECEKLGLSYFIVHSGQHYDTSLDAVFFKELNLPEPKYNLNVGSSQHIDQLASMMQGFVPIFKSEHPDVVLVQGDTNTVLAASLVASRLNIPIGHVEAGLRSYDRLMPEETNRIIADHLANWLFCPTELQRGILLKEGFNDKKIFVTGNTVVDSVLTAIDLAKDKTDFFLKKNGVMSDSFFFLTCHRPSNTDNDENLLEILNGVAALSKQEKIICLFPVHPRLNSKKHLIEKFPEIKMISPVGYLESLLLQVNSRMIFTDSGGIQEESCILKKKCVVLSTTTERPEALKVGGAHLLSIINRKEIASIYSYLISKDVTWTNPFGDGTAASKIMNILRSGTKSI